MSLNVTLESSRLVYRPLGKEHCTSRYLSWLNDGEVTRYLEIFKPQTMDDLQQYLEAAENNTELLFWAIHIIENDKHIGNIKIDPINRYHQYGEYGIMMGDKEEWGKGYAREASVCIVDYCFKVQKLRKVNLGVVEDNEPAVKLYKSLGFQTEGVYKNHGLYDGQWRNLLRMAIFNPELA